MKKQLGQLFTLDFYQIKHNLTYRRLRQIIKQTCHAEGLTIIKMTGCRFAPHGESIVAILKESHFAVHTWPEHNFISFDIYTCTPNFDIKPIFNRLKQIFKPKSITLHHIVRGQV
ncbi:MAG: adenosylmethionine decarboxylase [bacterium]|nr:adenosylmethionine decarboxylase [bacterium]